MKLGPRLLSIAHLVPQGARLADIGTDHAYLPIYLVQNNIITGAIAGDVHSGPVQAAHHMIEAHGLTGKISVRCGDGLQVIEEGEADAAVIAGMGGTTIVGILSASPAITACLNTLILQPMAGASLVRQWLADNRWRIAAESLVEEEGRLYEIIAAVPGQEDQLPPVLLEIGPLLWKKRHVLLERHMAELIHRHRRILIQMSTSVQAKQSEKYDRLEKKLAELEEWACLLHAGK